MIVWFSKEDVLFLHTKLIKKYGGLDGLRDENMLESALAAPQQTFGSKDLYPTPIEKIARLAFGLVMNHPFLDGNKRIGAFVLNLEMAANGIHFKVSNDELSEEFYNLAAGEIDYPSFLSWVKSKID